MAVESIIRQLEAAGVVPTDAWHLAAFMEMEGWTNAAAEAHGYSDVFHMARDLFPQISEAVRPAVARTAARRGWRQRFPGYLWQFLRGVFFIMPTVLAGWASLVLGLSLWSYNQFGVAEATGIALGTILSFLATGGITQATARRGLFLISMREYRLARRTTLQMVTAGALFALLLGLAGALLLALFPVLSSPTVRMAAIYFPLLSIIWLFLGLLYMLQRELTFTAVVAAGLGLVLLLFRSSWLAGLPVETRVIVSQAIGLLFIAAASLAFALFFFRRLERRHNAVDNGARPFGWPAAVRQLFPFFLYGTLYFAFLFTDRVLAWSTPGLFKPQAIWFDGPYELGLDWAMLVLVLPMGAIELGLRVLVDGLYNQAMVTAARAVGEFNRRMVRLWGWLQAAVAGTALLSALLVWALVLWLHGLGAVAVGPLTIPVTGWVFGWGLLGYSFLAGALLNVLLLFIANQPWPAVRATAFAFVTSLAVGFVSSRFWYVGGLRYPQAVFGLVAGAAVFWALAGFAARQAVSRADHLLYLNT